MKKIKLMMPGASVTADYEEGTAETMFNGLASTMLKFHVGPGEEADPAKKDPLPKPWPAEDKVAAGWNQEVKEPGQEDAGPIQGQGRGGLNQYRGFLYIKCRKCGEIHAFCAKTSADHSICRKCGTRTFFTEPLRTILMRCECGHVSMYQTNMEEEMFDIQCIECKAPVAVAFNQKRERYETIRG